MNHGRRSAASTFFNSLLGGIAALNSSLKVFPPSDVQPSAQSPCVAAKQQLQRIFRVIHQRPTSLQFIGALMPAAP
jgi:hypothetical protein